jgi:mono/diheme cytochrome c family protein
MKKYLAISSMLLFACASLALAQDSGADTYKSKCQMCHGPDGSGNTPAGKSMKATPLNTGDAVKASDADLIAITKNGKNKMPAFSGKITDAQITDVIAYVRTLQKK